MIARLDKEQIRLRPMRAYARVVSHLLLQGRPLTTQWQWLNPIIFAQFNLIKKLPQLKKVKKPIFILGTGRSGTTILGTLLALHPHNTFLNEPKALWHSAYRNEDIIGSYSRGPASYTLTATDATPDIIQDLHRLYGYSLLLTGSRRIVDKYPELLFRIPFLLHIFPDAKLVLIVRNGWDTSQSVAKWSQNATQLHKGETYNWWGVNNRKWNLLLRDVVAYEPSLQAHVSEIATFTDQRQMALVEWIASMQQGLRLLTQYPHQSHLIRYETLVEHPVATLTELSQFCELPHDDKLLAYAQTRLHPTPPYSKFSLPAAIAAPFQQTMAQFNYPTTETYENSTPWN